ncbi:FAD-dependent oxidoreductase [Paracoccus gahaiensis]|uniref:FAD-dependent oxidoreductase n=1 Tax=Paracoccus gahaiensis TaxID=1706839 RepID=A0A4U0RA05_9RHOB|nr:FAD-dependent oxidoreductase [Paracoccus gahaiensis]TJZ91925.1 FAD-dependent oxidoreductase [Paracoccus gahaiensis]
MGERIRVAIIGAGLAGLTCGGLLAQAGLSVTLFDKGRGPGGRLATRRAEGGLRFDHGAPCLTARDPVFAAFLDELAVQGHAAPWPEVGAMTGLPGMSALPKALAAGLDVRQGAMVTALNRQDGLWHLGGEGIAHQADLVVLAIPAPQARDLLGADHAFAADLARVRYHACVTLMAGLDTAAPRPFVYRQGQGALHQIWQDGAKPGRADLPLVPWVAHADPDWSMAHIDLPFAELADLMAPLLLAQLGADPAHLHHAAAHRWLYARTDRALGRAFLSDDAAGLVAGGDWALGPDAEHGWASGRAMAAHLLARA